MAPSVILVDGAASMAQCRRLKRVPGRGGAQGVRYNQKGGRTVVVRVVLAGRGGVAAFDRAVEEAQDAAQKLQSPPTRALDEA